MNFNIKLIKDNLGKIQIDDFEESFYIETSYWNRTQYEQQWKESIDNIKNEIQSVFITSIPNIETGNVVRRWICYIINNEAIFQEHLLFLEEHNNDRNIEFIKSYIPPYESIDEDDGEPISEWKIKINNT